MHALKLLDNFIRLLTRKISNELKIRSLFITSPNKIMQLIFIIGLILILGKFSSTAQTRNLSQQNEVKIVLDEAEAVVTILNKLKNNAVPTEQDWALLFNSEGYLRLQRRERSFGNTFTNEAFKSFLMDENIIAKATALSSLVESWRKVDLKKSVETAAFYLPKGTTIDASLYPVFKPHSNSFVFFEENNDPGIFIYMNPDNSVGDLENTISHELHHIGYASSCSEPDSTLPKPAFTAKKWAGAFGEGLAMLAAAGGPEINAHALSSKSDQDRWNKSVDKFDANLLKLERFFIDILEENLVNPDTIRSKAMSFFGIQGPWYSVGWKMAATIEKIYGRQRLISEICDPWMLMETYNQAVDEPTNEEDLPKWSKTLFNYH